jgi:hypothetical protein
MPHKALQSIFNDKRLKLPYLERDDSKSFLFHYSKKMSLYLSKINSLTERAIGEDQNKNEFVLRLEVLIEGIKETLKFYLEGFPSKAYEKFKETVELSDIANDLINIRTVELPKQTKLYRVKKEYYSDKVPFVGQKNGILPFISPLDLLHIPFEKRKAVPSNRFSIPGFPCVYLSNTLQTSWSECALSATDSFHAICFANHRPLYVADLVPISQAFGKKKISTEKTKKIYQTADIHLVLKDYCFLYPLISACHTKIKYTEAYLNEVKFKSEYIIPQLLLQWYREKEFIIDGIRYLSCTAEERFPKTVFSKFNYVIPVINCCEKGYCSSLVHNFSASPVYSYLSQPTSRDIEASINKIVSTLDRQKYKELLQP